MTETTDVVGAGEIVESAGEAWTFAHVGPAVRGSYSAWLKARARQGLRDEYRQGGILSEQEYREESDALKRAFDAGHYNWGSPFSADGIGQAVAASLDGWDGRVKLLQLLLEPAHGKVPAEKVVEVLRGNPDGCAEALRTCLDPNRKVPAPKDGPAPMRTTAGAATRTTPSPAAGAKDSPTGTPT